MAGTHPDVPGPRIPYDLLNFHLMAANAGSIYVAQFTTAQMNQVNDEDIADGPVVGTSSNAGHMAVIFPERYDLAGYTIRVVDGAPGALETSLDTTDGMNGTWTAVTGGWAQTNPVTQASVRTVNALTITDVKAIRFAWTSTIGTKLLYHLALYGAPTAAALTAEPHRLRLWHPTLDQPLGGAALDFGDLKPGQTATRTFRVKNNSGTQVANSVSVARTAETEVSPAMLGEYTLSSDGTTFATSLALGNLAAGALSPVITLRRIVGSAPAYSASQLRVPVTASGWA